MQKIHKQKNQFHILSLRDEKKLSPAELAQYYADLRIYSLQRKLTNTTPGALTVAPHLKGVTDKIVNRLTNVLCRGPVEVVSDGQQNIPKGPVIFAFTHQGILDNFVWIPETPCHCVILHSAKVKTFLKLAQLNTGLILVSKKDEDAENRKNARLDMLQILLRGHSIAYFPESAWNLSPNRLHLPMSYGFLDIARKADVPVVPVAMEFTYDTSTDRERITKVHIRYGQAIVVNASDSLAEKLEEYSEAVSTMRWELIEEKGSFSRKDVSEQDYRNYLKGNLRNLKMGGIDINVERDHIRGAREEFYRFYPINDLPLNE